jgi:hypothetical protein
MAKRDSKMKYYNGALLALLAGAISGAIILGLAGRVATAGVALITGNSLNLSLRGVLEVVIVGTFVGAIGGVLLLALRNVYPGNRFVLGIIVGIILFVCSIFFVSVSGRVAFDGSFIQFFTLGVVAAVFVIYGIWTAALLIRFNHYRRKY